MSRYYYSTQPFLAWCYNHYFFNGVHFAWLGAPFYPYRLPNPTSSNPLRIYQDLYEPWKDRDRFSFKIEQMRLGIRKGVIQNTRPLSRNRRKLTYICDSISHVFFYPIVYRVDIDLILPAGRKLVTGSGATVGSQEYKVTDLKEQPPEFDLILVDLEMEGVPQYMIDLWNGVPTKQQALRLLEAGIV